MYAAKEKKHHCRSVTKLITNGAMQAQTLRETSSMYPKTELNVVQMKRASTWPWPKRQCSGDMSSLLAPWPAWREIFTFSDDNSVCDSGLAPGGCENFDSSRTVSLIAANLGSKDLQVRSLSWQRKFRRGGNVLSLAAVAHFLAVGLESVRGSGWSMEVLDTSFVAREQEKSENPEGGA